MTKDTEMNGDGATGRFWSSTDTPTEPPVAFPAIIACGYFQIEIQKSGNKFPAFLVAFSINEDGSTLGADGIVAVQRRKKIRFAWRTKRDFLILARSTTRALPKAALKKIAEEAVVPWRRSSFTPCASDNKRENYTDFHNYSDIPGCLTDPKVPNRFSAKMKKSLRQLDRFLQDFQVESTAEKTAWEVFCRPSDTKDLICSMKKSQPCIHSKEIDETENSNQSKEASTDKQKGSDTSLQESSRLGQYFASKENSRKVVECALDKVLPLYREREEDTDILFLEPSCGFGDIVVALVESLRRFEIPSRSIFIQGYDIDPSAIERCRQRPEFPTSTSYCSTQNQSSSKDSMGFKFLWETKSFFETSRENCFHRFDEAHKTDLSRAERDRRLLVCCLGGPPYTTGQGSGSSIERDLPTKFVEHCRKEWDADVISFLLPERYREGMQHNLTDCFFPTPPVESERTHATNNRTRNWICVTEELNASTFFFRGTTQVTQPSIIQTFFRDKCIT